MLNADPASLPGGYPMHLHFDATTTPSSADLFAASLSAVKGDDFRIVYNNAAELPRFVQSFDSGAIDIWFNLQAGIGPHPAADRDSYQLYYANPAAASPPGEINSVIPPANEAGVVGNWHFQDGAGASITDGTPDSSGPVVLGQNDVGADRGSDSLQGLRISNVARGGFSYGGFGDVLAEPDARAGDPFLPPQSGTPDLAVLGWPHIPTPPAGRWCRQSSRTRATPARAAGSTPTSTRITCQPGPANTGSPSFWVSDPIAAGAIVTLTTLLDTSAGSALAPLAPGSERSFNLYAQTDSAGTVSEADHGNNIYADGLPACAASADP